MRSLVVTAALPLAVLGAGCPGGAPGADERSGAARAPSEKEPGAELTERQREDIERLRAIGYSEGTEEAPERSGVTVHEPERAFQGLNLVVSAHFPGAVLLDMEGAELHRWEIDFRSVWPDAEFHGNDPNQQFWRRAHLAPDGHVTAIFEGNGIFRIDRGSNLVWESRNGAHHDLEVLPSGEVYVLTREPRVIPRVHPEEPVLEDFVALLDSGGREVRRVSLLRCFEGSQAGRRIWESAEVRTGDIFHTNTLALLDGSIAGRVPAFERGRILTSMLVLNAIAVVDLESEEVVWARRGSFRHQHDPQVLENGNLLLFDNEGGGDGSRVIEFDPLTMEVAWSFEGSPGKPFYSRWCGAAQRLPNGNTLITESSPGRALEVTPLGEIVWEYANPGRVGARGRLVAKLLEVRRLGPEFSFW